MGTELSVLKPPGRALYLPETLRNISEESEIPYHCIILKHFERASDIEKFSFISEVIPMILSIYPSGEEVNELIQLYFYNPNSIKTNILMIRDNSSGEIGCFAVYFFFRY
jgi:hypothetical protein